MTLRLAVVSTAKNNNSILRNIQKLSEGEIEVSSGVYSDEGAGQFIQKFDPDLSTLLVSTTFGSDNGSPSPINICQTAFLVDNCNRIFVAGWGGSTNSFDLGDTNNMPVTESISHMFSIH